MLLKKAGLFWKNGLAAISFVLMLSITGCSHAPQKEVKDSETAVDNQAVSEEFHEEANKIIRICIDLYEKAAEENKLSDLETIRGIVSRLGENGYTAVDSENQIDMTHAEQVERFCEMVDAQKKAEITIIDRNILCRLSERSGFDGHCI